jgi:hypothetical protein
MRVCTGRGRGIFFCIFEKKKGKAEGKAFVSFFSECLTLSLAEG